MSISVNKDTLSQMIRGGANYLYNNRQEINDLNVFPVPDGDTGDNMFSTINEGVARIGEEDSLCDILCKVAKGMLLGARGNSGVILSKIASGISKCANENNEMHSKDIINATEKAIEESYGAVMNPQEGTILTVFREAARYANSQINVDSSIESYLDDFILQGKKSVEDTPNHLPILKESGVVDSGGVGIIIIAEGMKKALKGEKMDGTSHPSNSQTQHVDYSVFNENSILEYGYCTEFLLQLQNSKVDINKLDRDSFADYLKENGNSVVSFFEGNIFKVHVHTMKPGEILNHYQQFGEFLTLKIENMSIQHSNKELSESKKQKKKVPLAIVSVTNGDGISNMFREMGADYIIPGGQSSNPSVSDFIYAFNQLSADNIIVLPNNSNIILAAKEAGESYADSNVYVIESKDIGQGYAALSVIDKNEKDIDSILASSKEAMASIETFSICSSIRDTNINGVEIHNGDYFSFSGKKDIYYSSNNRYDVAENLIKKIIGEGDVVLVIYGSNCNVEEVNQLVADCEHVMRTTEFIVINGGQPIYDYIIIKE